ncbi:MAG: dihydropteroate synthase [Verrucomicrobiota bacterium]
MTSTIWQHPHGHLKLTDKPIIMGILNTTPDSFSDGNCFFDPDQALMQAEKMIGDGAQIIDVGGESTRPGATPVLVDEEISRTRNIIRTIHQQWPNVLISIDTYKGLVAEAALENGASIINDVSACRWDPNLREVVVQSKAGYVCMHALDRPAEMQASPAYQNAVEDIFHFLRQTTSDLMDAGVEAERIVCDPGIGFGKTLEHNLALIRAQEIWKQLERPILWGLSRKSYIGKILQTEPNDRLIGTITSHAWLLAYGCTPQIWRVHDVKETHQLIQMWKSLHEPLQSARDEH